MFVRYALVRPCSSASSASSQRHGDALNLLKSHLCVRAQELMCSKHLLYKISSFSSSLNVPFRKGGFWPLVGSNEMMD